MTTRYHVGEARTTQRLQKLLVATDFSANAEVALKWAIELATLHQADITLTHVLDSRHPAASGGETSLRDIADKNLAHAERLARKGGVSVRSERTNGKPWEVIPKLASEIGADLVVIGALGASNLGGRLLGSTADRIVRSAETPVVTMHPGSRTEAPLFRTVVAAVDFSEASNWAVDTAVRVVRPAPSRLVLLHVVAMTIDYPSSSHRVAGPKYWDEMEREAASQLEKMAGPLRGEQLQVEVKTVRGLPSEAILGECRTLSADLIAVGTQGRSGLSHFFLGSVAEWVLHRAERPVLTVRKT